MESYSNNVRADEHMGAHGQYTLLIGISSFTSEHFLQPYSTR
jgi:hypothetical protein